MKTWIPLESKNMTKIYRGYSLKDLIKINWNFTCMQGQRLWSWLPKRTCSQLLGPSPGLCQNAYPIVARYWLPGYWPLKQRSIDLRVIIFVPKNLNEILWPVINLKRLSRRLLWIKFVYSEKATKFCEIFP